LDLSREIACAIVANSLIRIATRENGGSAAVRAGMFILRCRGGPAWKDQIKLEVDNGGAGLSGLMRACGVDEREATRQRILDRINAINGAPESGPSPAHSGLPGEEGEDGAAGG
jgi:hypothetical protein